MRILFLTAVAAIGLCVPANAAFVSWTLTSGGTGNPLTFTASGSEAGVSFSSAVTLGDGVGLDLTSDGTGTGVTGGAAANSINSGQVLLVNAATITSVTGGTVVFDGFTGVNLVGFQAVGLDADSGIVAGTAVTADGLVGIAGSPSTFTLIGTGDNSGSPGFQANGLFGSFTVTPTAVPEPSSLAALAVVGIGGVVGRRRRAKAGKTKIEARGTLA